MNISTFEIIFYLLTFANLGLIVYKKITKLKKAKMEKEIKQSENENN